MTDRYTIWACFGVDADSPEQAKTIIEERISDGLAEYAGLPAALHRINPIVFVNPGFDKLIGMAVKKAKKGE